MAISIPQGFTVINTDSIDTRMLVPDSASRLSTSSYDEFNSFHGLLVYQQDTNELYSLLDPYAADQDSSWKLLTVSGSLSPGGDNNEVQFNNNGEFDGDPRFLFTGSTGRLQLSGSFEITGSSNTDIFIIKSSSLETFKVNNEGIIVLGNLSYTPTAVEGGIYYSSDNFFVGVTN